jgi:hypothetical protein
MSTDHASYREAFLALATSAGFDPNDPHLDMLRPEVETLLDTVQKLRRLQYVHENLSLTWREDIERSR